MLADSVSPVQSAVQIVQTLAAPLAAITGAAVGAYLTWRFSIKTRRIERRWEAWYDLNHRLRAYCDTVALFQSVEEDHIEAILEWGGEEPSDRKEILREIAVLLYRVREDLCLPSLRCRDDLRELVLRIFHLFKKQRPLLQGPMRKVLQASMKLPPFPAGELGITSREEAVQRLKEHRDTRPCRLEQLRSALDKEVYQALRAIHKVVADALSAEDYAWWERNLEAGKEAFRDGLQRMRRNV